MKGAIESNRRQGQRAQLRTLGTIDMGDHTIPCRTIDISEQGMALVAPFAPPTRSIRVRFQLGKYRAGWVDIEGRVIRCSEWDGNGSMVWGLSMHQLDLGTRTRLRDFVRSYAD